MKKLIPTVHIDAQLNEIAKTVILPGDPLRAKKMAEKFLKDVKLVSSIRNNYCYTGLYKNIPVSIMSTGMGPASMGIYSYELFNFYNVQNAIRVGTIGSLDENLKIGTLLVGESIYTDTNYNSLYEKNKECKLYASKKLLNLAKEVATLKKYEVAFAPIYTTDTFYLSKEKNEHIISLGAKGIEMEGAALYENAKQSKKEALCICTISDEILTNKSSTSKQRQNNYDKMFRLALEMAVKLNQD